MIKKGLCVLSLAAVMMADTTMCFKKDWIDPSTIETTVLDGGKCGGSKSLADMKADGWAVEDIKISSGDAGMNFMYVLKKGGNVILSDGDLEARLNKLQDQREAKKEVKKKVDNIQAGKARYEALCQSCHGDGTIVAYNIARPLVSLEKDDFELAIDEYVLDVRRGGMAILMKPYASLLDKPDIKNIWRYIETLKKNSSK